VLKIMVPTLVGEGDAKPGHAEVLIIAARARSEICGRIGDRNRDKNSWRNSRSSYDKSPGFAHSEKTVLGIVYSANKVPGEIGHQTDVTGNAELQPDA